MRTRPDLNFRRRSSRGNVLFRPAYCPGHEPASRRIDAMCGKKDGRPCTDEDIANWYKPIAEEGYPDAQAALATSYEHGSGGEQS